MGQLWPAQPRLIQHGEAVTTAAGRTVVTYPQPFASRPTLIVSATRTESQVIITDAPVATQSATRFEVGTYIAGGGITGGRASWIAVGVPG